ncbi:MAG: hypothetical protein KA257_01185 [Opitutaceae bacterium]|nr:hypothetical protein [Opitutaceae bacterium]MBP9912134.1 hypothetical protein [Opitutaceae bacterium]
MNLEAARSAIILSLGRMNALYQAPVFDEWVLAKMASEQGVILAYSGPRAETYKRKFLEDVTPLRTVLGQTQLTVGDFVFAAQAGGTHFDACIRLGTASYLFCNNTTKAMTDIRQNPRWIEAQKPFAALSAQFQADPLQ